MHIATTSTIKILIVDDENIARLRLRDTVEDILPSATIYLSDCATTAYKIIEKEQIDILFTDIIMPQTNGLDMIENIRTFSKNIYTVVFSSYEKFEFAQKGIDLGVVKYLVKPYHKEDIYEVLLKFINGEQTKVENSILFNSPTLGFIPLQTDEIVVIEKDGRNSLILHTKFATHKYIRGTLLDITKKLPDNFIYLNRTTIANFQYLKSCNTKTRIAVFPNSESDLEYVCSRECIKDLSKLLLKTNHFSIL